MNMVSTDKITKAFIVNALSSAEASLYGGEAFVLRLGRKKKRARGASSPARFLFFSIIDILMGIPSGSLCGGESCKCELGFPVDYKAQ